MAAGGGKQQQQEQGVTAYYEEKLVQGYTGLVVAVQVLDNEGGTSGSLTATFQHSISGGPDSRWEDMEEIGAWLFSATLPDTKVKFYPDPTAAARVGFMQYVRIKVVSDASSGTWEFIAHIEAKGH